MVSASDMVQASHRVTKNAAAQPGEAYCAPGGSSITLARCGPWRDTSTPVRDMAATKDENGAPADSVPGCQAIDTLLTRAVFKSTTMGGGVLL